MFKNSGFTLIELIIVIAILSIVITALASLGLVEMIDYLFAMYGD